MDAGDLTVVATAIAAYISKCVPQDQLVLLASLIGQVSDSLDRIIIQQSLMENNGSLVLDSTAAVSEAGQATDINAAAVGAAESLELNTAAETTRRRLGFSSKASNGRSHR